MKHKKDNIFKSKKLPDYLGGGEVTTSFHVANTQTGGLGFGFSSNRKLELVLCKGASIFRCSPLLFVAKTRIF